MIGERRTSDGVEFEVVWDGGEGLVADRATKAGDGWTAPRRIYNRTGKHAKKAKVEQEVQPINIITED